MLRNYRLQNYNFKLVFNVLVLMAMSLLFIHSAKASYVPKQALGIIMGLGIIVVVSLIDYQVFTRNAEILYILNVIMLIGVKLFGKDEKCKNIENKVKKSGEIVVEIIA